MAPSAIRKAIGAVKDQTTIGIAKVSSNEAPELEVAMVKATSHDNCPASEKCVREILRLSSNSYGNARACVALLAKRLGKTRNWIVSLKCLMLVHKLLNEGGVIFHLEIMDARERGTRLFNVSDFRDEAHSSSWDHFSFVRTYAMYLEEKLEMIAYERKPRRTSGESERFVIENAQDCLSGDNQNSGMQGSTSSVDVGGPKELKDVISPKKMNHEMILKKMIHLQRLLDGLLLCFPTGFAKNERMVLVALYTVVKESFHLYTDISETLTLLLDEFFDMEYPNCVQTVDAYASAAKKIEELVGFYSRCKDIGLARSWDYPEVQKIDRKLFGKLEGFLKEKAKAIETSSRKEMFPQQEDVIEALPARSNVPETLKSETRDLVDLRDEEVTAEEQGNKLALALFGSFPANNGRQEVISDSQHPAAENGETNWELALTDLASHVNNQVSTMAGRMVWDPLSENDKYDQGVMKQQLSANQMIGLSASAVALSGSGEGCKALTLALTAPHEAIQAVVQDPFAASLSIPPPTYVQLADLEKEQHLMVQAQIAWQQYTRGTNVQPMMSCGFPRAGHTNASY